MVDYPYIVTAPQPYTATQSDWVNNINMMEAWLDATIGAANYMWVKDQLAFRRAAHMTLFILAWY